MQTAVINIKVEPKIKKQAQKVADELGLSLSGVLNGFLRQFIHTKTITFSIPEEPSDWMIKNMAEAQKDIAEGRVTSFENADDAIKYLDQLIEDDKRPRRQNRLHKKVSQTAPKIATNNQDSLKRSIKAF